VTGDSQARIREGLGVKFPGATRPGQRMIVPTATISRPLPHLIGPSHVHRVVPAGGNDNMGMRMEIELLTPGMQHTEEADLRAEKSRVASHFEKGFRAGAEQEIVDDLLGEACAGMPEVANGANSHRPVD